MQFGLDNAKEGCIDASSLILTQDNYLHKEETGGKELDVNNADTEDDRSSSPGVKGHSSYAFQPKEVKLPLAFGHEEVASISIGKKHGIAITITGKAFTYGKSACCVLENNNKTYISMPHPILLSRKNPLLRIASNALNSQLLCHLRGEASVHTKA